MKTHSKTLPVHGVPALLVLALLIGLGVYRRPFSPIDDPQLQEVIEHELRGESTRAALPQLRAAVAAGDEDSTTAITESLMDSSLQILNISGSQPLLRRKSREDVVVQVEFMRQGEARTQYYRCRHSLFGGWSVRGRSSKTAYYLNLL